MDASQSFVAPKKRARARKHEVTRLRSSSQFFFLLCPYFGDQAVCFCTCVCMYECMYVFMYVCVCVTPYDRKIHT